MTWTASSSSTHGTLGLPFHLPYEKDEEWAAINMGNVTLYIFKSEVGEHAPRRTAVNPDECPRLRLDRLRGR